jgi:hypothetical protein
MVKMSKLVQNFETAFLDEFPEKMVKQITSQKTPEITLKSNLGRWEPCRIQLPSLGAI